LGHPADVEVTDARNAPDRPIGDRYVQRAAGDSRPKDRSADREAVIKHVAAQTGMRFTTGKRKVWVLSVKKADE
jgi:hypothetical protein